MVNEKLEKLRHKKQVLDAQIKQEENREKTRARKADTRRKILAGAAALNEAENNPEFRDYLYKLIDSFYKRADDRALFGLPPYKESAKTAPMPEKQAASQTKETKKTDSQEEQF
ncbi:MAG TPA: hypothetical protein VKY19_14310 [Ktedonosporobacter sp.]|jgi:hypothetical protein|nr:hypothetical protein [Ktedonosporobacter sp.]